MAKVKFILSDEFVKQLKELGIIDDNTRRVIIDAQVGHIIKIHLEKFGDERLLNLVHTMDGIEILAEIPIGEEKKE